MSQSPPRGPRVIRSIGVALSTCVLIATLGGTSHAAPPANDNFLNAIAINPNALPFAHTASITEATIEGNEPIACSYTVQTVWYRITPVTDVWLTATGSGSLTNLSVFRDNGGGLSQLSFLTCTSYGTPIFLARAGGRYYFQAGAYCCGVSGTISISVRQVPPPVPVADFGYYPSDPSSFDTIQFYDQSNDPGQQGFATRTWDFGDGTSADTTCCPTHRYTSDGDYVVRLTVTTTDGRTASVSRTLSVKTHDVAITNFKVPQTAHLGQTRQLTVSVSNTRYPEMVRVELQRGLPGSNSWFQFIGSSEQFVLARQANRSTDFTFNYTISPGDANVGKVSFKAIAYIVGARDAFSADNEALSLPIRLSRLGPVPYSGEVYANNDELEFALLNVAPNPARAGVELAVRLSLAKEGAAEVQVLDIAGRVVGSRDLGVLPPGVHDARIAWASRPSAGIYWVRLVQEGQGSRVARVAILD